VVMVRVEHVIDSWKTVRQDTASAVEDFPEAEYDFRPAPDVMTFREAARHILDAGDGLTGLLLAGDDNFTAPDFRDRMKSHLRSLPADASPSALAGALRDSAGPVRGGAITALGHHRAAAWRDAIRGRLDDPLEDADVRAVAASALGGVCDAGSVDRLTALARALALSAASQDDQVVALGALAGLAAMQPRDLRERLGPLLTASAPPSVRAAAEETLDTRGACR